MNEYEKKALEIITEILNKYYRQCAIMSESIESIAIPIIAKALEEAKSV